MISKFTQQLKQPEKAEAEKPNKLMSMFKNFKETKMSKKKESVKEEITPQFEIGDDDSSDDDGSPQKEATTPVSVEMMESPGIRPQAAVFPSEDGEVMSGSSSEEEEEEKEEEPKMRAREVLFEEEKATPQQPKTTQAPAQTQQEESSSDEDEYEIDEEEEEDEEEELEFEFSRPKRSNCVQRLPKVGQKVNLNQYEVYFAVRKLPKPILYEDKCESISKEENERRLRSEEFQEQPPNTMRASITYTSQKLLDEFDTPTKGDDDPEISARTTKSGGSNSTSTSSPKPESPTIVRSKKKQGSEKTNEFKSSIMKSFKKFDAFYKRINKSLKSVETQTAEKSNIRYITFDQGRLLVLKRLREKVEGETYSEMRNFPTFARSADDEKYKMPAIVWNAKIVRVYPVIALNSIRWKNFTAMYRLNVQRLTQEIKNPRIAQLRMQQMEDSDEEEKLIFGQYNFRPCRDVNTRLCFNWNYDLASHLMGQDAQFQMADGDNYKVDMFTQYSKKEMKKLGYRNRLEIDSQYELPLCNLKDLIEEIDIEKKNATGMDIGTKLLN